jgi:hypothetical protein
MSGMTGETGVVIGGVDTHSQTHYVAVTDRLSREVGDREFPATAAGYEALAGGCGGSVSWAGTGWRAPAPMARAWAGICIRRACRWWR